MNLTEGRLSASPTDVANFLACRHKTSLDLLVAMGELEKPKWEDPLAKVLRERGIEHERRYVNALRGEGLTVVDLGDVKYDERPARTLEAMRDGVDVIVQAALSDDRWVGYADVLRRVDTPSPTFGAWSYEAHDTKLARETRGGTILQLCVYTELIGQIQGCTPEHFRVVTPASTEPYRFDDFSAYYRQVKAQFLEFVGAISLPQGPSAQRPATPYPDPVDHCDFCRWFQRCNAQRRKDDHLSFVAGLGRIQQVELEGRQIGTLAALAAMPVPLQFQPNRGSKETYERVREQARLQLQQRDSLLPVFEELPIEKDFGLTQLPEPRPGDLFLDLEGDPFARPLVSGQSGEGNRDYLFGLGRVAADGTFQYTARWAFTDADERDTFDAVITEIMAALDADPAIHVYHYAAYEASAFRRLMGRYATREVDVDRLLRGRRLVDLFDVARHAIRAGVESYSIKNLEPLFNFTREIELDDAGHQRRLVEVALETNDFSAVTPAVIAGVEGYNKDDCRSLVDLQRWLESLRSAQLARGAEIVRPPLDPLEPSVKVLERDKRAIALRAKLLDGVPDALKSRTPEQQAKYLLAYLMDWHRREERVAWGEYHRLRAKPDEELLDEPLALVSLRFVERVFSPEAGSRKRSVVDRYSYPVQENDLGVGDEVRLPSDKKLGSVEAIDKSARTIDIKKSVDCSDVHPPTVIGLKIIGTQVQEGSIQRVAACVLEHGLDDLAGDRLVNDLLLSRAPRVTSQPFGPRAGETSLDFALRTVFDLDGSLLAIQGPPGSGKTFTGAHIIAALVTAGRKVGVVATGHKVIRKLLIDAGIAARMPIPIAHKRGDDQMDQIDGVVVDEPASNEDASAWLAQPGGRVLGGTSWMWARPEFAKSVDVLFVDEAGQMSLANTLAVAPAAGNLVLLGDPQQLDQPQKGSHPDGVDLSALDHILDGHQTMPEGRGIFLDRTWRLAPAICDFTSKVFYEGRLESKPGLECQRLAGHSRFSGAGVFVVGVAHDGCRNASTEEAEAVATIVEELLAPAVIWTDEKVSDQPLATTDILIVAPYNAHVARLQEVVGSRVHADLRIGTVDKFQGQQAPVVIYSMATSRPEDAPRGMEFLYSLNRLNVATSRAKGVCILVASPRLFEPDCRTPRQMQLANALCRYREMAQP